MLPELHADALKSLLENLRSPERLDEHPWTMSQLVLAELASDPALAQKSPGFQLATAVSHLFHDAMPATPPKRGKRLDTHWGEFGLLAAQYFAPFVLGAPPPASLREAWGKIDAAILLFVYGKLPEELSEPEIARYKLVGDEPVVAANSTLSDWHRKGLEQLARLLLEREQYLSRARVLPARPLAARNTAVQPQGADSQPAGEVSQPQGDDSKPGAALPPADEAQAHTSHHHRHHSSRAKRRARLIRGIIFGVLALFLVTIAVIAEQAWEAYRLAQKIRAEVGQLQGMLAEDLSLATLEQAGPLINTLRADVGILHAQTAGPLKLLSAAANWAPAYRADLAAAPDLLELANLTANAAWLSYQSAAPVLKLIQSSDSELSPQALTKFLVQAHPQFYEARQNLAAARAIEARINPDAFAPQIGALIEKIGPLLDVMDDGLSAVIVLPKTLGASDEGPKTYLLLLQNEDELRATGGYLSSVGSFVVREGDIFGLKFENTDDYEDWAKPYPAAPWQVEKYMNIPVILLRDANWSPDYPASVSLIEFLYAYKNHYSADGVIAIDQQSLVTLLQALGPITIQGVPEPISADNVVTYMRQAKIPPEAISDSKWDRKAFIGNMASAILKKLLSGEGVAWESLARALLKALDERHILLQFDDPDMTALVARHNWDGAVRPGSGDFLLSVDTNIGYNKTNALVDKSLAYDVDLRDPAHPTGSLVVFYDNRAVAQPPCVQWGNVDPAEQWYQINRCYYNYLRIYLPSSAELLEATSHAIPAEWMMLGVGVPAQVDTLEMGIEKVAETQGFGTLLVVPGQQTLSASFKFALPGRVLLPGPGNGEQTYLLKIQKQAGTRAIPLTLRLHLPTNARLEQVPPAASVEGQNLLLNTTLATDVAVKVIFSMP